MATVWQICAAQETAEAEVWQDLSDVGISNLSRSRQGDGMDKVAFTVETATALTDAALFAFHSYVRIRKLVDDVPELWFYGRVTSIPRMSNGGGPEVMSITVSGPGEQLAAVIYRQAWEEHTGTIRKPLVVLFQSADGSRCTTGAQIKDAVSWAKSCGVKIAEPSALNIITGAALPFDERLNINCADVIAECLRWHPHAVCWWDYTLREPVFHCALRSALAPASVALSACGGLEIVPRQDLQVPAVCIAYSKTLTVDDETRTGTTLDWAPVIEGESDVERQARLNQPDVVFAAFDLDGSERTFLHQKIVTEDIPTYLDDKAWWKERVGWLKEYDDDDIVIENAARMHDSNYNDILVEGELQPWMGCREAVERVCADVTVTKYENGQLVDIETRLATAELRVTNARTRDYTTLDSYVAGEAVPEGVALALYEEWSTLHYAGSLMMDEQECSGTVALGRALNITGGSSAWASMFAMVSATTEDVDSGTTTVEFGPIRVLDADTLVALFRATRNRKHSVRRIMRSEPVPDAPQGDGDAGAPTSVGYSGLATTKRKVIHDKDASVKHLIDLDSAAFAFATAGDGTTVRIIKPRERVMPYIDGGVVKAKLAQVLASEGYGDELNVGSDGKVKANSADTSPDYLDGKVEMSVTLNATSKKLRLSGDVASPGNYYAYCTNGSGTKGWLQGVTIDF